MWVQGDVVSPAPRTPSRWHAKSPPHQARGCRVTGLKKCAAQTYGRGAAGRHRPGGLVYQRNGGTIRAQRIELRDCRRQDGTAELEAASGIYNELQAGSYVFMDADYARNRGTDGGPFIFGHSLTRPTTVMSVAVEGKWLSTRV